MDVKFNGFDSKCLTFICNSTVNRPGQLVKISASRVVDKCGSDDIPVGITIDVRNGYASVLIRGYFEVAHNGTVTPGYTKISACNDSMIKRDQQYGKEMLVVGAEANVAKIIL